MSGIDLAQLLDEKKKLEESLKNLNHKIDELKESETFGKYFSSWTAEEMTMEKLKQKFGVELCEFLNSLLFVSQLIKKTKKRNLKRSKKMTTQNRILNFIKF
jgi:cell division septum initiation protein DivIVA